MTRDELSVALLAFGLTAKEARNFLKKFDGDDLQWGAAVDFAGYGSFGYQGKTWKSHRLVFAALNPDIDITKLFVVQRCGKLRCCDPKCLYTQATRPMRCDPEKYSSKLHPSTVERMRKLVYDQTNKVDLARTLGVSVTTVRKIMQGFTWKQRHSSPSTSSDGSNKSTTRAPILTIISSRAGATLDAHPWRGRTLRISKNTSWTADRKA